MKKFALKVDFDEVGKVKVHVRKDVYRFLRHAGVEDSPDDADYSLLKDVKAAEAQAVFGTDDPPCKLVYKLEIEQL